MPSSAAKPVRRSPKPRADGDADQLAFWVEETSAPEPVAKPKRRRTAAAADIPRPQAADPRASAMVGREILTGRYDPGVWALALARSSRGREEAEAEYARIRILSLQDEMATNRQKETALEERRRAVFRKIPEADPATRKTNLRRRHPLPVLPLFGLWLAASAALAMVWRFAGGAGGGTPHGSDMLAHLAMGAMLATLAWALHEMVPVSRRFIRYGVPVAAVLMAAVSLLGAVLVLKDASVADLYSKAPGQTAPQTAQPTPPKDEAREVKVSTRRVSVGSEF